MIKVKYSQFKDVNFVQSIQKLSSMQLPFKSAYQIKRMVEALTSAQKKVIADFQKELGDDIAPKEDAPAEDKAEFERLVEEFANREFVIERPPLEWSILEGSKVTSSDLIHLTLFFNDVETIPAPVTPLHAVAAPSEPPVA